MSRISMIATALIVGLLAGSAANARANSKDKQDHKAKAHKIVGLSPVDFPTKGHGDKDNSKNHGDKDHKGHGHHGKHHSNDNDPCKNGSMPPKENMGGSSYSPPGTPGNPVMPSKPTLPRTPIKYYGTNNKLVGSLLQQTKGLNAPGGGRPGQGRVPTQGKIPNIGTGWLGFEGAVGDGLSHVGSAIGTIASAINRGGFALNNAWGTVANGVYDGVSGLVSEAGSILGDIF